jgi:hypothetical protein
MEAGTPGSCPGKCGWTVRARGTSCLLTFGCAPAVAIVPASDGQVVGGDASAADCISDGPRQEEETHANHRCRPPTAEGPIPPR